ncbi:hypothetical protein FACS189434_01630 [Bacteroidia bacterium]|nr:hypothetical protein FACS189434_01630 [Bacteroidia bacterium]
MAMTAAISAQDLELTPVEKVEQRTTVLEGAVKTLQKFKVSGYIQTQYQYGEKDADGVKVGNGINDWEKNNEDGFSRIGIRRGRIKFLYENGIVQGVFQPDITDKGFAVKDVYLNVKDPWIGTNSIQAGVFNRPFGHEIAYSSSRRESPERARIIQSLFPDERDLGAMLTLQADKNSAWNILKLEAGLFGGNGIRADIDSKLDFIGHLSVAKNYDNISFGAGVSGYFGGVFQNNDTVYSIKDKAFAIESTTGNKGKFAKRQYIGFDAQFSAITVAGLTQLRAEYIFGEHPGKSGGAYDFKLTALPLPTDKTYLRNVSGGYIILTQDLGTLPFSVVAKYDWYDPNTDISGDDIKGAGEILKSTIGFGALWRINPALRLTAYYDIVKNETSKNLAGYDKDRKDNVFTLRLQYKF